MMAKFRNTELILGNHDNSFAGLDEPDEIKQCCCKLLDDEGWWPGYDQVYKFRSMSTF